MTKKMENLIFCAYATDTDKLTSPNIRSNNYNNIYLRNIIVSLVSAKLTNPECDVALITNIEVPKLYKELLLKNSVIIFKEEFDEFLFPNNYKWGLAFYKLNACKKALNYHYQHYLLIDTDTYVQSSLDDLWLETQNKILLYDINHRLSTPNYEKFDKEIKEFLETEEYLTNYGGEFIAGNRELLTLFISHCEQIYYAMRENNFYTSFGDEFIICIAAHQLQQYIKNAGGYIFRFWTGSFRLVSTCYEYNAVSILHVPGEKENGMIKLYSYYIKNGKFPLNKKVHQILHLSKETLINKPIELRG